MANRILRGFFNKFNRGEIDPSAFAREEVQRIDNSCETMENFMPQRIGPMFFRPGTEAFPDVFIEYDSVLAPFITSIEDPIICVVGENGGFPYMRFFRTSTGDYVDQSSPIDMAWDNGSFSSGFSPGEWEDHDEGSATSVISGGSLTMTGTGSDAAIVYQQAPSVTAGNLYTCKVNISRGSCTVQFGNNSLPGPGDNVLGQFNLGPGTHFLTVEAISSTEVISMTITNSSTVPCVVNDADFETSNGSAVSVDLEPICGGNIIDSGDLSGLQTLRWAQSSDVMYFCGKNYTPFLVKRWDALSFSVEKYEPLYGPYEPINLTDITMNPTAPIDGDTNVIASRKFFVGDARFDYDAGTGLKFAVSGQTVTATGSADDVATDGVFVFGTGNARKIGLEIVVNSGSGWTVWLEKSFDEITWQREVTYTTAQDITYDDGLDNAEVFYRLRIETANAANLTLTLSYDYGTLESEGRIWRKLSDTSIDVAWYVPLTQDQTVQDWYIGSWGGAREYPTALAFHEGRLWFAGGNKVWGSESDFYESFDRFVEGASASIEKTIGLTASNEVFWMAPSARLVVGTPVAEVDVRSSAFGEILTPENTNLRAGSDMGCANVPALVMDQEVLFVQRGRDKLIGLNFTTDSERHGIEDFNLLSPKILEPKVVRMAYVRNPETRIFLVLDDGTVRVLLRDQDQDVLGWSRLTLKYHNGTSTVNEFVRDVVVVPGSPEDQVYFLTGASSGLGELVRLAKTTEVGTMASSKHFDHYQTFTSPGTTITLNMLGRYSQGDTVGVIVDGVDDGDYVINVSNQITGVTDGTDVIVGYRYTADYLSNKLTDYDEVGVINERKRILDTGLVMTDYVPGSVKIGPALDDLGNMPLEEDGQAPVSGNYDYFPFPYPGRSTSDPRIAIQATGPCRIIGFSYNVKSTANLTRES